MLRALTLKNFKSFRDETIRFSKTGMTVLVGTNGSGKSSVLDAASYATFSFQPALPALPGAELVRAGADGFELELSGEFEDGTAGCEVVFRKSRLVAKWFERAGVRQYTWDAIQRRNRPNEEPLDDSLIAKLERAFPVPRVLKVSLARLRHPMRGASTEVVEFEAPQVVQTLFDLKMGTDPNAFNSAMSKVSRVVPALKSFGIARFSDENDRDAYGLKFNMSTGSDIPASQVSEGTLFAMSVIAATELTARPVLLIIDDLDRALHPTAQRELVRVLREVVKLGRVEVLCTTHSPYILSEFHYDEVRVLREVDGVSRCQALSDGPDAAKWMKELDAGEYWSFVEKQMFEKRSA